MNLQALKSLTILYVEDYPFIRENAVEYLSRYCKKVLQAKDGEDGYAIYQSHYLTSSSLILRCPS